MSKERLVELLTKTMDEQYEKRQLITPQHTADYLLANGVYVLPCKIGDYIEWDTGASNVPTQLHQVRGFFIDQHGMLRFSCKDFAPIVGHCNILRTIPREEAEAKLKESEKN
jgi:hypothetical protein